MRLALYPTKLVVCLSMFTVVGCMKSHDRLAAETMSSAAPATSPLTASVFYQGETAASAAPLARAAVLGSGDGGTIAPPGGNSGGNDGGTVPPGGGSGAGNGGTTSGTGGAAGGGATPGQGGTGGTPQGGATSGGGTTAGGGNPAGGAGPGAGGAPGGHASDGGNIPSGGHGTGSDGGATTCRAPQPWKDPVTYPAPTGDAIEADIVLSRVCTWHWEPIFFEDAVHPTLTVETGPIPEWLVDAASNRCVARATPGNEMPVYALTNGWDHVHSSTTTGSDNQYRLTDLAFFVFTDASVCSTPLMSCRYGGGHFLSTRADCEGQIVEGPLGNLCAAPVPNTAALHRLLGADGTHDVTTSWETVQARVATGWWRYEGALGYVPTAPPPTDSNLVLAKIDLTGFDFFKERFQRRARIDLAALKRRLPDSWQYWPIRARVCDDRFGLGSCAGAHRLLTLSKADLVVLPGHFPRTLALELFSWRIPNYRPQYYTDLPDFCERLISPLVLDLDGDGIRLSGPEGGVMFDLAASGTPTATGWTLGADDAFLVRDLDGNGAIDDGSELFGSATRKRDGTPAANGFEALKELDDDHDGRLTPRDAAWTTLRAWIDRNHDGVVEPGEILTLDEAGIAWIAVDYESVTEVDRYGNQTRQRALFGRVTPEGIRPSVVADIWFASLTAK